MDGEDSRQYWGITFDPWPRRRFNWPDERERPAPNTYLPYTIEEARRFVLATPQAFRPQILCAILLMLRDGELRAMRWKHLNEEKGLYYVCETTVDSMSLQPRRPPAARLRCRFPNWCCVN